MNKVKIFSKSQFSILWWSGSLSSFGDWATLFASVALASQLGSETGNSGITAVVPVVARIIPAFLSSFAGLMADRMNKKNIMIFTDLSRMLIVLFLFFATSLVQLFIVNFLTEIFSLMRQPSRESIVPEIVHKENLVKANSLFAIGTYATLPIASILFALIADIRVPDFISNFGNGWSGSIIFIFDAFTFFLSAYLLVFLKTKSVKPIQGSQGFVLREFKEGLNYFYSNQEIRNITVSISLSLFAAGSLFILGHTFLTVDLGFTESSFGFMIASFGTGIIFSMVTFSYFISSFSRVSFVIGLCMLSTGISLYTAFISTEFINILLSIFISGVGTGGVYLLTISFLQATTDQQMRGRVFGNFYTIGRIALLLSFLTSGLAANYLDPLFVSSGVETVLKISSLLILISGLITFISSYKKIFKEFGIENSNFNNIKLDFKSIEDEPE
ncbi:MAG: MFS transporter [Candidatus Actinomarina sp.]|nr:MFS transporter [Candidatus Actinomarina sp.]NND23244.1 MFS transporter [Acidimicrobiia bacterium]